MTRSKCSWIFKVPNINKNIITNYRERKVKKENKGQLGIMEFLENMEPLVNLVIKDHQDP